MRSKHRQITRAITVNLNAVTKLPAPAAAAFNIQHLLLRCQTHNTVAAVPAVLVNRYILRRHAHILAPGQAPFTLARPQRQPVTLRKQPANRILARRIQRQSQSRIVTVSRRKIPQVIRPAHPYRLRLLHRCSEHQPLLKHLAMQRVTVPLTESLPAPVIYRPAAQPLHIHLVRASPLTSHIAHQHHIMPVTRHNQPVPATVGRPARHQRRIHALSASKKQPQPALLVTLVTRQLRVARCAHPAERYPASLPLPGQPRPVVTSPHLIRPIPQPRAVKLPRPAAGQRIAHSHPAHEKPRIIRKARRTGHHVRTRECSHTRIQLPVPALNAERLALGYRPARHTLHRRAHRHTLKPLQILRFLEIVRVTLRRIKAGHIHIGRPLLLAHIILDRRLRPDRKPRPGARRHQPVHNLYTRPQTLPLGFGLLLLQVKTAPQHVGRILLRQLPLVLNCAEIHLVHHAVHTGRTRQHHRPITPLMHVPPWLSLELP